MSSLFESKDARLEIEGNGRLASLATGIGDDIDVTETLRRRESVLMRLVRLVFLGMNSLAILLREEAALGQPETFPSWPSQLVGAGEAGTGGVDSESERRR